MNGDFMIVRISLSGVGLYLDRVAIISNQSGRCWHVAITMREDELGNEQQLNEKESRIGKIEAILYSQGV